ncbi:DUF126 domain-containing protein [Pseudomonas sp. R5(2019)]|nr:DUF126 domain-containing protein [Pseudomonas sp. R5(2019)]NBA98093.1 DUF126 domain-containing protein [Pseudomonas sp. R5(2019)]
MCHSQYDQFLGRVRSGHRGDHRSASSPEGRKSHRALHNGHAPAAIILNKVDEIIALGVVIFDEFFGRKIPVVQLDDDDFEALFTAGSASISENGMVMIYE